MSTFDYSGYDSSGGKIEGEIEAADEQVALLKLKSDGLLITKIALQESEHASFFKKRVTLKDIEFFTSELALLLASGVRIDKGIEIIKKNKANSSLSQLLKTISKDLKKGNSLSQACREHPQAFDRLYCNLIELGESSGNLAEVFADLAKDLKFKRELKSKVISSLTYPSVVFAVCVLSVFFIFNVIIPKMAVMFTDVDSLPWYTKVMLSLSDWVVANQTYLIVGTIISIVGIIKLLKTPEYQKKWQGLSLKLPVIGNAVINLERIRFNNGLAMMIKAGVPIDQSLKLANGSMKNHVLIKEMEIARTKIKRGANLTSSLKQTSIYPDFYVSLLEVGEESGNLEVVFREIAERSKSDFEQWSSRMTTLLEPLMILFMGGFIGTVVIIMLLSMVSVNQVGF